MRHPGNRRGPRRRPRFAVSLLAALLALASACAAVWAYSGSAGNNGNELVAAADWVAPVASSSTVGKTQGGVPGYIRQGGSYYVYASVGDSGAPASGISTVSANASTLTTGQGAAALTAGTFSAGGVAYNYRSASLSAKAVLAAGTYGYALTSTDAAANSRTQSGYSVVVDNAVPTASDIQTANKSGGIAGRPEIGDSITYTFSEPIDPHSIFAGWTGASTGVVVRIANATNDPVTVYDAANAVQLPFGSVALGRSDYVSSSATFGASGTASTMVQSGNAITLTLGTASSGPGTVAGNGTMTWTPSASAYDRAGNAETTTAKAETGSADREF